MTNRRLFSNYKELLIRQGHSIREYTNEKRVSHINGINLLLILIAITSFLDSYSATSRGCQTKLEQFQKKRL